MSPMQLQPVPIDRLLPGDGALPPPAPGARPIPAANGSQAFFRLDLMRSLQRHRRLALGIALAGVALAVAYWFYVGPVYQAQSIVYIQPAPPRVMAQGPSWPYTQRWPYDSTTYESYIQQQMENVTRSDVLTNAVQKMDGVWLKSGESEQSAVERLRHSIKVTREGTSYQFTIGAHASNAAAAAAAANAVASSFIESASHEQKAGDSQRQALLGEERDRVLKALAADRAEQETLNKQLGVAAIGAAAPDVYDEDIGRIRGELITARAAHDEAAAKLTSMDAKNGATSAALDAEADVIVAADPGLMSMKTSLNQRRAILISQMANLTPSHPLYKQDAAELAQINSNLDSMMKDLRAKAAARIEQRMRTDLEQTAGVEARLNRQLAQLTGAAGDATAKLQRSSDLAIDINRLQNRFTVVDDEWRNLMLEEGGPGSAFLSAAATPPLHPVLTGVLRNMALIIFAGLFFAVMAAVVAQKMDPRIYIAGDVEHVLGFAPMAQLPDFGEVSDGVAEEHLLRLAAAIEAARKQGSLKNCIFTGTGPGAGVTTLATRVRDMLESMGRSTLLVDATGSQPAAPRASSAASSQPGTQALVAAPRGSRSTALLQQIDEETQTQDERLVITDTAPLVLSAETEYLARFVDCAIVAVESGVTTRAELLETANTLQRLDVAAVGFVLNRVELKNADEAFRLSVEAIEKHLRSQGGSMARRKVSDRAFEAEAAPAIAQLHQEETSQPQYEPAVQQDKPVVPLYEPAVPPPAPVAAPPRPAPAIPESAVQAVARLAPSVAAPVPSALRSSPVVQESAVRALARLSSPVLNAAAASRLSPAFTGWTESKAKLSQVALRESSKHQAHQWIRPMTTQKSDLPWWLADLIPQPEQPRPAAASEPAKVSWPQSVDAAPQPEAAAAPKLYLEPRPVQSWERAPASDFTAKPAPVAASAAADSLLRLQHGDGHEAVHEAEQKEGSSNLESRLSGLRSLLSVLGKKERQKVEEPVVAAAETVQRIVPVSDDATPARTLIPALDVAAPPAASAAPVSPERLTPVPEFLPPRTIVVAAKKESAGARGHRKRRDRMDEYDDVQTLPSRRGQYKKR